MSETGLWKEKTKNGQKETDNRWRMLGGVGGLGDVDHSEQTWWGTVEEMWWSGMCFGVGEVCHLYRVKGILNKEG